jgi:UDP-N-acetylglucosamine/UDP-N-acetylgalactosamine diphosphorylase
MSSSVIDYGKFVEIREKLRLSSQDHLISHINEDNYQQYSKLLAQISSLNLNRIVEIFHDAQASSQASADSTVKPVDSIALTNYEIDDQLTILDKGQRAICEGSVAAVILSGGQGTRLGFAGPKGMYDIGLPSKKSIFQLHVERIIRVKELLAADMYPMVYIMTSDLNDAVIRQYFKDQKYFGYPRDRIMFFEQGLQPCLSNDGKLMLESEHSLAMAPDGNGGLYLALESSGAIEDMYRRGVQHLHVYGIDNVLTKALDPAFIGLCIHQNVELANKVVWRANKSEKVGVTVMNADRRMRILEYSEIPVHLAEAEDVTGKLVFGAANICNHYFSLSFIRDKVLKNLSHTYHIAMKKIPCFDTSTMQTVHPSAANGMKLEMFIFDVFALAEKWLVMEVDRAEEFAPVKNEPGNKVDSPDTARTLISNQNKRWLLAAGASLVDDKGEDACNNDSLLCEISCLLSYTGENLDSFHGMQLRLPTFIEKKIYANHMGSLFCANDMI